MEAPKIKEFPESPVFIEDMTYGSYALKESEGLILRSAQDMLEESAFVGTRAYDIIVNEAHLPEFKELYIECLMQNLDRVKEEERRGEPTYAPDIPEDPYEKVMVMNSDVMREYSTPRQQRGV